MYRKRGYIIARMVGLLAVLLMAFFVAIQTPLVQTRLSKIGLNQLVAIMDGRVQYDELKVMTSGVIVVRNLKLIDTNPYSEDVNGRGWAPVDTVAQINTLTATFSLSGLFRKEGLHMGRVTIEGGSFHMVSEPGEEYHDNLSRIFHLKATDAPPSRDKLFDVKKLRVKDFRFQMNSFLPDRGTYKGLHRCSSVTPAFRTTGLSATNSPWPTPRYAATSSVWQPGRSPATRSRTSRPAANSASWTAPCSRTSCCATPGRTSTSVPWP